MDDVLKHALIVKEGDVLFKGDDTPFEVMKKNTISEQPASTIQ